MEITILKFSGTKDAEEALRSAIDAEGNRRPWLQEVGVVTRPTIGRITIRATYADAPVKEGDIASKVADAGGMTGYFIGSILGPMHADSAALTGEMRASSLGKALEKEILHTEAIKKALPRGSSALVLVATPQVDDEFVALFKDRNPEVIRRDLEQEVEKRLQEMQPSP
jgi:uncharacterized membrane protein